MEKPEIMPDESRERILHEIRVKTFREMLVNGKRLSQRQRAVLNAPAPSPPYTLFIRPWCTFQKNGVTSSHGSDVTLLNGN